MTGASSSSFTANCTMNGASTCLSHLPASMKLAGSFGPAPRPSGPPAPSWLRLPPRPPRAKPSPGEQEPRGKLRPCAPSLRTPRSCVTSSRAVSPPSPPPASAASSISSPPWTTSSRSASANPTSSPPRPPPPAPRRFFDIVATRDDVISPGIGEPDFVPPPPILQAGLRSIEHGDTHYPSNSGTIELRNAVADHLRLRYGIEYDARSEVLITVGVSEALYLALTAGRDPGA